MAGMDRRRRVEWIMRAAGEGEYASIRRKISGLIMRKGGRTRENRRRGAACSCGPNTRIKY